MLAKINALDLLHLGPQRIGDGLPDRFILVCEDGEIETTRHRTAFTWFFWEFHRQFPEIPLRTSHTLEHALGGKPYNSNTHLKIIETIAWDVMENVKRGNVNLAEKISEIGFRASIDGSNFFIPAIAAYITPIDVVDAIAVLRHPKLLEARKLYTDDPDGVTKIYDVAREILLKDPEFSKNGLAIACRSGTVKIDQVLQSVALRGDPSEADGSIFETRIAHGYLEGLTDIYEFASDSRSAVKAQSSTEKPIQDNDFMSRRLQLLASVVEKIEGDDCGAEMVEWLVSPKEYDGDGNLLYPGGIKFMPGKIYADPETGEIKEIQGDEDHLNGQYIRMRSVLNCKAPNPHAVCRTCFGGLWRNIYDHTNLGHLATVTLTEKIIQATLSIKHLVGSARGERVKLSTVMLTYFDDNPKDPSAYYLSKRMAGKKVKVTVNRTEALKLFQLMSNLASMEDLRLNKLTRLTQIRMQHEHKGEVMFDIFDISQAGHPAFITRELIDFLRTNPMKIDKDNNFEFSLEGWNITKPLFGIPKMETSAAQHGQEVGKMIESNMESISDRQEPESPLRTLHELFELVTSKLDVPLTALEILLYSFMIPAKNNKAMARGWDNPILGVTSDLMTSRSLSSAYAFQKHVDFMLSAKSFFPHFRPDIKMDVFFAPEEVLKRYPKVTET